MAIVQPPFVKFDKVSFHYPVFQLTDRSLKVSLVNQLVGGKARLMNGHMTVQALRTVSFELSSGDRLGLIGQNGSGKSSVLRLIAGLAFSQAGSVSTHGRLVSLIEKGLGINPELSGLANIELPLRLLGASTEEVNNAKKVIPEFTGLGDFINFPVRTYSEGMRTRLSFAICTSLKSDILVLDEWLGAGDLDFQERAQGRLTDMIENTGIVVLASHSLELVSEVCNKVAWMDKGLLRKFGPPAEVIKAYREASEA